nr:reverse transcriptase [Tanacetum cinerariifolium]
MIRRDVFTRHIYGVKISQGASEVKILTSRNQETFFSPNVEETSQNLILTKLEVREASQQTMYLGHPSTVGRKKRDLFQAILDKVRKKISGWKERNLSIRGKEVLLKSVAQAMPMPMDMKTRKTLYDGHLGSLCVSKYRGGMGFRHMNGFNKVILAKQGWKLITMEESLPAVILKARSVS